MKSGIRCSVLSQNLPEMKRWKKFWFGLIDKIAPGVAESVKGDLEEEYHEFKRKYGRRKASLFSPQVMQGSTEIWLISLNHRVTA